MSGIYIHIPFCKQACHYCDFHFSVNLQAKRAMLKAIQKELILQQNYLNNATINSIYIGGGTPSLLDVQEINEILICIKSLFPCESLAEITLELNPDDITLEKLLELRSIGI